MFHLCLVRLPFPVHLSPGAPSLPFCSWGSLRAALPSHSLGFCPGAFQDSSLISGRLFPVVGSVEARVVQVQPRKITKIKISIKGRRHSFHRPTTGPVVAVSNGLIRIHHGATQWIILKLTTTSSGWKTGRRSHCCSGYCGI